MVSHWIGYLLSVHFFDFIRVNSLLNSRSHKTELATAAQRNQSLKLKLTVENAFWRNGM
jgi:hypothetical protein